MDRRKFLVGVGSASLGGSALLGSGAFSRVESHRNVTIQVAEDPDAYLGLKPLDTPNSQNYVELDENGHLRVDIGDGGLREGDGPAGEGVNSNSRTWFDGMFDICNQGKEDACIYWEFGDDFEMRDEAELIFYYDGDEDGDETTEGRVDVEAGREVPLEIGECARIGLRTETFDVDATEEGPLFEGNIKLVADVDLDCFEDPPVDEPEDCPEEETWDEVGDRDEAGGPVILMELDSELGPGSPNHGPPYEHAAMVEALLDDVTNGQDGILVLGGDPDANQSIKDYWETDLTSEYEAEDIDDLDEDVHNDEEVTFVHDTSEMEEVDFNDYAMVGVVSTTGQISDGLTNEQNEILSGRRDDFAEYVNAGGGLLGKTQYESSGFGEDDIENPWGYVDPFGDFERNDDSFSSVNVTDEGKELGLTQDGMDGWCCYHGVLLDFPDFFDVLIESDGGSNVGEAAAIGGSEVVVEREVALAIDGYDTIVTGEEECYDVEVENQSDETIEDAEFNIEIVSGSGSVTNTLPDTVTLEPNDPESWDEGLCLECENEGTLEVEVAVVDDDGSRLVRVTMDVDCVDELPEEC